MNDIKNCSIEIDENGTPCEIKGIGLSISWKKGALGRGDERRKPNGAFVETVLSAVLQRLESYQTANDGKFKCRENAIAITKIEEALLWLDKRTRDRESRKVEGTHTA